jgi:hypothetical protein
MTVEQLARTMAGLDRLLVAVLLVLAFLVALFPVRNSDFWLHLAAGRALVTGQAGLTAEPFAHTASAYWVNHSWLYDIVVYASYQTLGGAALVILKGLLVAGIVALMLGIHRRGHSLWIPAVCTAAGLVALSPRLLFQPVIVSYFLLALTLWLLLRRELGDKAPEVGRRSAAPSSWLPQGEDRVLWLLPVVCLLWVNLDSWFLLGPLALTLYLVGEALQGAIGGRGKESPRARPWAPLLVVLGASIVACLVSPYHVHGVPLPAEIGATGVIEELRKDDYFRRMFVSPFEGEYIEAERLGIAGYAYYPLVALGILSFVVNVSALRAGRLLVWLGFFALSAYHARAIPFFAVVAGPITALNFQEYVARRFGLDPVATGGWKEWSLLGRGATLLLMLVLVGLSWPGWLHGFPNEVRRVGLTVEPDPSLVRAAAQLDLWRSEGVLTGKDHALTLSPESANTFAWLCPAEKGYFDYRFYLYSPEVAREYIRLRQIFSTRPSRPEPGASAAEASQRSSSRLTEADWVRILKARGVTHMIVYSPDVRALQLPVQQLQTATSRWVYLHGDGHTAIFGLIDPPLPTAPVRPQIETGPWKGLAYDPAVHAYGERARPLPSQKPHPPQPIPWWARYARGPGARPLAGDDAYMHLMYYSNSAVAWHFEQNLLPQGGIQAASLIGHCAFGVDTLSTHLSGWMNVLYKTRFEMPATDVEGNIAPLLLAVRSGREALLANPNDEVVHERLGVAYQLLRFHTEERRWGLGLPVLSLMRQAQMATAYRHALLLRPELIAAHQGLAELYSRLGYTDLWLKHLGEQIKYSKVLGPQPGELSRDFSERIKAMETDHRALEKQVREAENKYPIRASNRKVLEKASIALELGLAETALNALLSSDAIEFGATGARLQLDLLLSMGRVEDLRTMIAPDNKEEQEEMAANLRNLGPISYELYRILLAAAEGDYEEARHYAEEASQRLVADAAHLASYRDILRHFASFRLALRPDPKADDPYANLGLHEMAAVAVAQSLLVGAPGNGPVAWLLRKRQVRDELFAAVFEMVVPLQQQADFLTLAGVLALESGDSAGAEKYFRQALHLGTDRKEPALNFGGRLTALRCMEFLTGKKK